MSREEMEAILFTVWDGCAEGQYRICPICREVVGFERRWHIEQHLQSAAPETPDRKQDTT